MDRFIERALNDTEYMEYIDDIYNDEHFTIIAEYPHHDKYTRLDHCLHVSYSTFLFLKKLAPKYKYMREACRGSLLHDFFLYEWHTENPFPIPCMHAWKHPERAYQDASRYFEINLMEKDIILTHMFPVCIAVPLSRAAWTVVIFDKYWAFREGFKTFNPIKMLQMQLPGSVRKRLTMKADHSE